MLTLEVRVFSTEYTGANRSDRSLWGAQFGEKFGEVVLKNNLARSGCNRQPKRFWKPGRGQNVLKYQADLKMRHLLLHKIRLLLHGSKSCIPCLRLSPII
jgi:hypothetical protein